MKTANHHQALINVSDTGWGQEKRLELNHGESWTITYLVFNFFFFFWLFNFSGISAPAHRLGNFYVFLYPDHMCRMKLIELMDGLIELIDELLSCQEAAPCSPC